MCRVDEAALLGVESDPEPPSAANVDTKVATASIDRDIDISED